ncbi:hypothetical protein OHU45_09105 [Streptomyces tubercidicus]|uniref:hypothetical protein n=1 Tax=Streptomyces tubercidicus TaxID=47759 RepID=UPI0032431FF0
MRRRWSIDIARIRTIKPEAFNSESLAAVSLSAERTFFGLLTQSDDHGRFRDQPAVIAGLAMLLDAAMFVVLTVQRHSAMRHHDRQVTAARQTLIHLQAAYDQIAPTTMIALARHRTPDDAVHRYARHLREALPVYAEQILTEDAWPALTATLAAAEAAGHNPDTLLRQAARQRPLDDANSASQVLVWRVQRLGTRHAPGPAAQAQAARPRSPLRSGNPSAGRSTPGTAALRPVADPEPRRSR